MNLFVIRTDGHEVQSRARVLRGAGRARTRTRTRTKTRTRTRTDGMDEDRCGSEKSK